MAVIRCKMCGGDLQIVEGTTVAECEYCGSRQTVPHIDNEKKLTLFSRANRLRLACEFDKAAGVYECIVADFPEEAEAYWGLVLCRYGIEYVDDPATGKKVPTCHRSSFDCVLEDSDFEQACENADPIARRVYREEAKTIEEIRRGITEVSGKEPPYDIFICYKETDENGERTVDSVIAQDVYDALTAKNYRVFFSRVTLEDKLGTEYEPYIFAALNSSKIMLVFGTDYEYFNAVWVKNEWSRFLKLMAQDKERHLIPCFKGIDAYDMPKEFSRLQAQDMGKVGAVQDLLRGIEKLLPRNKLDVSQGKTALVNAEEDKTASLLDRGMMALEDKEWEKAEGFFENVLNNDSKNTQAYLGKFCADFHYTGLSDLENIKTTSISEIKANKNYDKAVRFASKTLKEEINAYMTAAAKSRFQYLRQEIERADTAEAFQNLAKALDDVAEYCDVHSYRDNCLQKANCATDEQVLRLQEKREYLEKSHVQDLICCNFSEEIIGLCSDGTMEVCGGSGKYYYDEKYRFRKDEQRKALETHSWDVNKWNNISKFSGNGRLTAGLRFDGTVVACGARHCENEQKISACRKNIVNLTVYDDSIIGVCSDGTVVFTGDNQEIQSKLSAWKDVVSVYYGYSHFVGLRSDGTVVACGNNEDGECDVENWRDIISISCGGFCTIGLRSDGHVVACGMVEYDLEDTEVPCNGSDKRFDVSGWNDIVAISCKTNHVVGLRLDGTVVATGRNDSGQCEVGDWKNIVAIATAECHTVGLRFDGTVIACGLDDHGQCEETECWHDIVAIFCSYNNTVGLCSNGKIDVCGSTRYGADDTYEWKLFGSMETLEQERAGAKASYENELLQKQKDELRCKEEHRTTLTEERTALQAELSHLKGLFTGKRRREIEARLIEIEKQLQDTML